MSSAIWNGQLTDALGEIMSATLNAMQLGDGVFETIRVLPDRPTGSRLLRRDAHRARLLRSAARSGYDISGLRGRLDATLMTAELEAHTQAVRISAMPTRSGTLGVLGVFTPRPYVDYRFGSRAVSSLLPHPGLGVLGKTCGYQWALTVGRWAKAAGAEDAVLLRDGEVVEAATAALRWRVGDAWFCPRAPGALDSVTAAAFDAREPSMSPAAATEAALASADQIILLSALRLAIGVASWHDSTGARHRYPGHDHGLPALRAALLGRSG
jgi:branched-subunit amino acid aminotransferase/4-amino-4-deoxychorismate lyase